MAASLGTLNIGRIVINAPSLTPSPPIVIGTLAISTERGKAMKEAVISALPKIFKVMKNWIIVKTVIDSDMRIIKGDFSLTC